MKIILKKNKLFKLIQNERNLGFVPTMGAIHLGHISLIKRSIKQCNKTLVSIFINKPQFNKKNDYIKYPRLIKEDISILIKINIDIPFPIPFSGIATGESTSLALDLGMASKSINISGVLVEQEIKQPLSNELLFGSLNKGGSAKVGIKDKTLDIIAKPKETK